MNVDLKPEVMNRLRKMVLSGKRLDELAEFHGITRLRYLWLFKESDQKLLARVVAKVKESK